MRAYLLRSTNTLFQGSAMQGVRKAIIGMLLPVLVGIIGCGEKQQPAEQETLPDSAVGVVNGRVLKYDRYRADVNQAIEFERIIGGVQSVTPAVEKRIRDEVFAEWIESALLAIRLEDKGQPVTPADVADAVENNPPPVQVLQSPLFAGPDGSFNKQTYIKFFNTIQNRAVVGRIEQMTKLILQRERVQQEVVGDMALTEEEAKREYIKQHQRGKVSYLWLPFDRVDVEASAITEDMLWQYYQDHQAEFMYGPRRQVAFVVFEDKPSETMRKAALTRIDSLRLVLSKGAEFSELARKHSDDPTSRRGGSLGWIKRGWLMPELEEAAFSGKPGQLVGPVETRMGYHLVKVEDKRGAGPGEEVKASHILVAVNRTPSRAGDLQANAASFRDDASKMGLANAARMYSVKVDTLPAVDDSGVIPGFGYNRELADFLLSAPLGILSSPQRFRERYAVFQPVTDLEDGQIPFEEAQPELRERFIRQQQIARARALAADIHEEILRGVAMEEVARDRRMQVIRPRSWITRSTFASGLEGDSAFVASALSLHPRGVSEPLKYADGVVIVRLDRLEDPAPRNWEQEKEMFRERLLQQKQQQAYGTWLSTQRSNANIKDLRARFE